MNKNNLKDQTIFHVREKINIPLHELIDFLEDIQYFLRDRKHSEELLAFLDEPLCQAHQLLDGLYQGEKSTKPDLDFGESLFGLCFTCKVLIEGLRETKLFKEAEDLKGFLYRLDSQLQA